MYDQLSISQIKLESSRLNFDKRAVDTLSILIEKTITIINSKNKKQNSSTLLENIYNLISILNTIHQYREEQQKSIFLIIQSEFVDLLQAIGPNDI